MNEQRLGMYLLFITERIWYWLVNPMYTKEFERTAHVFYS